MGMFLVCIPLTAVAGFGIKWGMAHVASPWVTVGCALVAALGITLGGLYNVSQDPGVSGQPVFVRETTSTKIVVTVISSLITSVVLLLLGATDSVEVASISVGGIVGLRVAVAAG